MIQQVRKNLWIRTSNIQQMQSVILLQDDAITLFDPGYFDDETREIGAFVQQIMQQEQTDKYPSRRIILTHSDYDHVVGVPYFPEYAVWAATTWDEANEARSIRQIAKFDSEFYVNRPWQGEMERIKLTQQLQDGENAGGLYFYHAQGHTDDGLVTVWDNVAVVGDYLASVEFPFVYTSVRRYEATLQHMREVFAQHDVNLVITQHGPYAEGKNEIAHRLSTSADYLHSVIDLVVEGQHAGRLLDEIVALSRDSVKFAGKPLPLGIERFHEANVRLIWTELSSQGC